MVTNFSFVIPGVLAGMARPGRFGRLEDDLAFLRGQGIGGIVSLTEFPLPDQTVERCGFRYLHLPVPDYAAPTLGQIEAFLRFLHAGRDDGAVAVHCAAGQGRTGTMLACALVDLGLPADEAIRLVRKVRSPSIDTEAQEAMVHQFELVKKSQPDFPGTGPSS